MSPTDTTRWQANLKRYRQAYISGGLMLIIGFVFGAALAPFRACAPTDVHHAEALPSTEVTDETLWTCSMHVHVRQSAPGQCPICGMELIPITSMSDPAVASDTQHLILSDRARALAQLRTTPVQHQTGATAQLRLLGRFEPNETTLKTVAAWTGGRIDRLHLNVTGEQVRAGQAIATLYSPEVFAAHQDLLVAKQQVLRMHQSPLASHQAAGAALDAARERLRLLGVPNDQLARMEQHTRPTRAITIRSPFSGTVIERLATEGSYVSTGTPLYRVANLSSLWLQLDAYENDLPRLSVRQPVLITVRALPSESFEGNVTFIDPTVDAERRTVHVRVQVDNRDHHLRPGMFAEATVATGNTTEGDDGPLVVPATAPLFTGRRAIVYVEVQAGDQVAYEPRTVRLGPRLGEVYPVLHGLALGDRVVTRGAFALDADLQIRGGASMMASADDLDDEIWTPPIEINPTQRQTLTPVLAAYLTIQAALADDDLAGVKAAASALSTATRRVDLQRPKEAFKAWSKIRRRILGHSRRIAGAENLKSTRQGFEPLSKAVIQLLTYFGNPMAYTVRLAFCPMASGSDGALWVQKGSEIDNSYFGASMLSCGEVQQELGPGSFLPTSSVPTTSANTAIPTKGPRP
ncbi:MAG: efflux RND transporter periplasmic adaptor subunit [Myxococcales bacterium]|nr:efflux RND transporter periplasmic adaptor subunit [Myxococcales bacterium]